MLDDTLGPAIVVKTEGKFGIPTIDLHTHFLSPLRLGAVVADAKVTKIGRTVAFTEGSLFDFTGKLCARATGAHYGRCIYF